MTRLYDSLGEDFLINMRLGSRIELPQERHTVLHLLEQMGKPFPLLTTLKKRGETYQIEEANEADDSFRWANFEPRRICCGMVNPTTIQDGLRLPLTILGQIPHTLGVSPIEIDYLDVIFGFNFAFHGNTDELVASTLLAGSPLGCITELAESQAVDVQPRFTFCLDQANRMHATITVETSVRDELTIYLSVRKYWNSEPLGEMLDVLKEHAEQNKKLCDTKIVPHIVKPIHDAIMTLR